MLKRIFTLMMVTVMLSCTYAYAEENKNLLSENEIKTVTSYNIFEGNENGDLMLEENVTRAQMCKILFAARGIDVKDISENTLFNDVASSHWAYNYISAAHSEKLVEGFPDGSFMPDENVKIQDVVKMIVCTLGYEEFALAKGGYPTGYIVAAMQYGITKDVPFKLDDYATRNQIVKLIYNSLDVPVMQKVEYEDKEEYIIMNGKNNVPLVTFRTMIGEKTDVLLSMITLDKENVGKSTDLSGADVNTRGNQEIYSFDYAQGDISSKHLIFYNDVLVAYQYDFKNVQAAYAFAKKIRNSMEKAFGDKTTYPGVTMTHGDYFDNIEDASMLKNGYKYFEDWTLAGTEAQMKHHKNWKPYLTDEQIIKKITGDKEYGRIDVSLVLDVINDTATSVSVKCTVLP